MILTRSDALSQLQWSTVAPLTRTIRGVETEVVLEPAEDRVPSRCAVALDNVTTIEQDSLIRMIAPLSAGRMNEVWEALHAVFDLPY